MLPAVTRGCCGGRRSRRRVRGQRSARGLVSQREGLSAIHQRCCASTYCRGTAAMTREERGAGSDGLPLNYPNKTHRAAREREER